MSLRKPPLAVLLLLATLTACAGSGSAGHIPTASVQQGQKRPQDILGGIGGLLNVLLCDAPPHIGNLTPTEIDLAIDSVGVVADGKVYTIAKYPQPYTVNVLETPAGDPSSIGIGQYFSGIYEAVQFTFDVAHSHLVANGASYPISFIINNSALSSAGAGPTTTTTGDAATAVTVTVHGNFLIGTNPAASIQADFNALESLAQAPDGTIVSRPTLFAAAFSEIGKIGGTVTNSSGAPVSSATVVAIDQDGNVANTTSTDANGAYELHTLMAGTYTVNIYNSYTTATGQTINASGNTNSAQMVNGPTVTVNRQETTQAPAIQD